jgi:hypothetical protein
LPPEKKLTAKMQRAEFVKQMQRMLGLPGLKTDDWSDIFWHLAAQVSEGQVIIVLDEINWMGNKDPTFLGKLKTAWDTLFKKNPETHGAAINEHYLASVDNELTMDVLF